MVQKLGAATPGSRPGIRRLEVRTRRPPLAPGATLRDTNAIGLQAFESNPDVIAAKRRFGERDQREGVITWSARVPANLPHQIGRQMVEAIAALDAAGDALADHGAGARKAGDRRLAPGGIVRMDGAGRGAGIDFGAEYVMPTMRRSCGCSPDKRQVHPYLADQHLGRDRTALAGDKLDDTALAHGFEGAREVARFPAGQRGQCGER